MFKATRLGKSRRLAAVGVSALAALTLTACSSSSSTPATTTTAKSAGLSVIAPPTAATTVSETGSSLLFPLFNAWAPAYMKLYTNMTISTASTGSGVGISDALNGVANIGASDAYLAPAQVTANPSARNIPLAVSSQFVGYNVPGITGHLNLSGPVLSSIYQGKITNWNDPAIAALNKGTTLPNLPIVTLHRADGSGDTFLFTQFLSKTDPNGWGAKIPYGTTVSWPAAPGALGQTGNSGMISGCQQTAGCIAYIGISYEAKATAAGIGVAALKNASGNYVLPTASSIAAAAASFASSTPKSGTLSMIGTTAAQGYPIVNYEYAIVLAKQPNATTAQAIQSVLSWAISPNYGNSLAFLSPVNFVPLPASVAQISMNLINGISS